MTCTQVEWGQGQHRKPHAERSPKRGEHRTGEDAGRSRTLDATQRPPRFGKGAGKEAEGRMPRTPATWRTWGRQAKRA